MVKHFLAYSTLMACLLLCATLLYYQGNESTNQRAWAEANMLMALNSTFIDLSEYDQTRGEGRLRCYIAGQVQEVKAWQQWLGPTIGHDYSKKEVQDLIRSNLQTAEEIIGPELFAGENTDQYRCFTYPERREKAPRSMNMR